jgi:hypothetical protein
MATETNTTDLLTSLRRTLVPIVVGFLLSQATRAGFAIPADQLTGVIEALVTGGYYAVIRIVEQYWPAAGVLLGASRQPRY